MSQKLEGKVAFITGAARGQGRSHAVRLAEEGADIIAIDIAEQIESVPYPMSTPEDLAQTAKEVEALGRRIVTYQADVRDFAALKAAVDAGVSELGRLDIIVANAGISSYPGHDVTDPLTTFDDLIAVNLAGVRHTVQAGVQYLIDQGEGGSIALISSAMGLSGRGGNGGAATEGYGAAKHGVVGLMRTYANWLGPHRIRVNSVHPTGVKTPMIMNDAMAESMAANPDVAVVMTNLMPVDAMEPRDMSNAVAFLVSDDARYITGVALPVDAGFTVK